MQQRVWGSTLAPVEPSELRKGQQDDILDVKSPPLPISRSEFLKAYPTEARLRQKAKLKADKEKGITPKKRRKPVEAGTDDCGDDLSGFGTDVATLSCDFELEPVDDETHEDEHLFIEILSPIPEDATTTNVFSAVATL